MWLIGALALICLALYAIPTTSVLGAIILTGFLGGAITSHLRVAGTLTPEMIVNRSFLTGKTHITGEDKLAARATGAAAKRRNRQGGDTREADQNIVPGIETSRTRVQGGKGCDVRDIVICNEEIWIVALEDDDVESRVRLDLID